jgi:hypothetical protein
VGGSTGDARYQAAPQVQQAIVVSGIPQSITITSKPPGEVYRGVTYVVTATGGGSGNPVTFGVDASSTGSACTISDATVTFGQPGRCVIDANQAGDARYQRAPQVRQTIAVTSADKPGQQPVPRPAGLPEVPG